MSVYDGWEPFSGGVKLTFGKPEQDQLNVFVVGQDVNELRNDLVEAIHDSMGMEALDITVEEILPGDLIYVLSNPYRVTNTLIGKQFSDESAWIVQFSNGAFSSVENEVTLPGDQQITVYRRVDNG